MPIVKRPTSRSHRPRRDATRGQSLVEFALVVPIFMLFVGGIVQFGMIFWGQNTINQIVRDGGRYAATVTDCSGSTAAVKLVKDATSGLANGTVLAGAALTVATPTWTDKDGGTASTCPTSNKNNEVVWVTVSASGTVPIFFPWIPGNGTVSSSAKYRVEPVQK